MWKHVAAGVATRDAPGRRRPGPRRTFQICSVTTVSSVKADGIRFAEKLEREKFRGDEESNVPLRPATRCDATRRVVSRMENRPRDLERAQPNVRVIAIFYPREGTAGVGERGREGFAIEGRRTHARARVSRLL